MSNFTDYLAQIGATITFSDPVVMKTTAGQFQNGSFTFNQQQINAARIVAEQLVDYVDLKNHQDMNAIANTDGDPELSIEELTSYVLAASYYKGYNDPNYHGLAVEFNFSELDANAVAGFAQTIHAQNTLSPSIETPTVDQSSEITGLQAAMVAIAASYVGIDIAHHDTGNRTQAEIDQVHEFNKDGLGGPWCADIMGHYFSMIAEHTGTEPLMAHDEVLSTDKLIDRAQELGAFSTFPENGTPPPGSILTLGFIKEEHQGWGFGDIDEQIGRDDLKGGHHTALVVSSETIQEGAYQGWTKLQTIDANATMYDADGNKVQTVKPLTYVINPETNEAIVFFNPEDYPDYPVEGYQGKFAAVGYVDPMDLPGAQQANDAILTNGFAPDGLNDGVDYLPDSSGWLNHLDIPEIPKNESVPTTDTPDISNELFVDGGEAGIRGFGVQVTFYDENGIANPNTTFLGGGYSLAGKLSVEPSDHEGLVILSVEKPDGTVNQHLLTAADAQATLEYRVGAEGAKPLVNEMASFTRGSEEMWHGPEIIEDPDLIAEINDAIEHAVVDEIRDAWGPLEIEIAEMPVFSEIDNASVASTSTGILEAVSYAGLEISESLIPNSGSGTAPTLEKDADVSITTPTLS